MSVVFGGGLIMSKRMTAMLGAIIFTLFVPFQAVLAEGAEEVSTKPTGLFAAFLLIMCFVTLITMIYSCIRDNG